MRFTSAIAACMLVFTLSSCAQPSSAVSASATCAQLSQSAYSKLRAIERQPLSNSNAALQRLTALSDFIPNFSESAMWTSSAKTLGESVESECGLADQPRLAIYFEWAELLRDQANEVFLPKGAACQTWARAAVRYDIASEAASVSALATHGQNDPDVRHVEALLQIWAHRNGMALPPIDEGAEVQQFADEYSRRYDAEDKRVSATC